MPTITVSVDCEAAIAEKCYTKELIRVAEEFTVPFTWLIYVSEKDPLSNLDFYRNEFFHRIPSWHEIGLLVKFESSQGYISDPNSRADLIRIAKDAIKSRHIKPTAFKSYGADLLPSDLRALEDIGILVDASLSPGAVDRFGVSHAAGPVQPYNPGYDDVSTAGNAKLVEFPVSSYDGVACCLDLGWERVKPALEYALDTYEFVHLTLTDTADDTNGLSEALQLCRSKSARFSTLTQIAADRV